MWRTATLPNTLQDFVGPGRMPCGAGSFRAKGSCGLASRTLVHVGSSGNKLVSLDRVWQQEGAERTSKRPSEPGNTETASQRRERENVEVLGGLRDPRRAVARSKDLQRVGQQAREVLDVFLTDEVLSCFENSVDECPFPESLIGEARYSLAQHFKAETVHEGYQLRAMLEQAKDPDATVLLEWLVDGFPIGINREITYTGVFPRTDGLTAAAKASQAFAMMDDWDGTAQNCCVLCRSWRQGSGRVRSHGGHGLGTSERHMARCGGSSRQSLADQDGLRRQNEAGKGREG